MTDIPQTLGDTPEVFPQQPPTEPITETASAVNSLLVAGFGLFFGLLGNLFFYENPVGINFPLYITLVMGVGLGLLIYTEQKIGWSNMLLLIPGLGLAALMAIRSSEALNTLNFLLLISLLAVVIRLATTTKFLAGSLLMVPLTNLEVGIASWAEGPVTVLVNSSKALSRFKMDTPQSKTAGAVLRGLMLAAPLLLLFTALLASSDFVFGDVVSDVFDGLLPNNIDSLMAQLFIIAFFGWMTMGVLKIMVIGSITAVLPQPNINTGNLPKPLGMIETGIILGSVNALFALYGLIQLRYMFGGEANITEQGYTYAEYARRGFFELVAVAIMTLGLVVILDFVTRRNTQRQEMTFRGLLFLMIGLTFVMIVSAFQRLDLYLDAYGFTQIRVLSGVFMVWLTVLFCLLVLDLIWRKRKILEYGCLAAVIGFVVTLNVMNMDAFIAARNIERYEETGKIDVYYLTSLSDDAIPQITRLLDYQEMDDTASLLTHLRYRLLNLDSERDDRQGLGYHWGKEQAWRALDAHRELLEEVPLR